MAETGTVYIVDDDPGVRAAVGMLVEACGWCPKVCASAEEFLNTYSREHQGCLILDLQMPGMSGVDLQGVLLRTGIDLPVIVVTAHVDHPLAEQARNSGAVAVIGKPFNDQTLVDTIREAMSIDSENH